MSRTQCTRSYRRVWQRGIIARVSMVIASLTVPIWALDFPILSASHLGGQSTKDVLYAVDVAPNKSVVAAGVLSLSRPGVPDAAILRAGAGAVIRFNQNGTSINSIARIGEYVSDLQVAPGGGIAVIGSFGMAMLDSSASMALWHDTTIERPYFNFGTYQARIAVGVDGTVGCMVSRERYRAHVYLYNAEGQRIFDTVYTDKYPEDICVDGVNKRFVVGGFNTLSAPSVHMDNHPIHMPYMRAYSYKGVLAWKDYQFTAPAVYEMNTFADSRIERITMGLDGKIYVSGYIHGGDHVFRHDPHDVTKKDALQAGFDAFSTPYQMAGGANYSYLAKFDAGTGDFIVGEGLLCRESESGSGRSRQIAVRGIHADENGYVYVCGWASNFISNRSRLTVGGVAVGPYFGLEPYVLIVAPDFRSRKAWTVFSRNACSGTALAISSRDGIAVAVGQIDSGSAITSPAAIQESPGSKGSAYMTVFAAQNTLSTRSTCNGKAAEARRSRNNTATLLDGRRLSAHDRTERRATLRAGRLAIEP